MCQGDGVPGLAKFSVVTVDPPFHVNKKVEKSVIKSELPITTMRLGLQVADLSHGPASGDKFVARRYDVFFLRYFDISTALRELRELRTV